MKIRILCAVFFPPRDDDIRSFDPVFQFLVCSKKSDIFEIKCKSQFFRFCKHLCIDNRSSGRILEESHLGVKIILQICVPVEMVGFEIGENGMGRAKCADIVRHETRNFDDDVASFETLLPYRPNRLREWYIEIAREEDLVFSILLSEELIEDPCGRRLAVRPGYGKDFEVFWEERVDEIELTNDLAGRINPVRRIDARRRDNRTIARKISDIIRVIHHLGFHLMCVTKRPQGVSDFSFAVNTDHKFGENKKIWYTKMR